MKRRNRRVKKGGEMGLGAMIMASALFHVLAFGVFALMPSSGKASDIKRPKALMFDIEVADRLGSGVGGTPKKGPSHDGKIDLPDPPPEPKVVHSVKQPTVARHKVKKPRKSKPRKRPENVSDMLLDALKKINEGREGDYTRPDGDPNSANAGPPGPPGGDSCAVYRGRTTRYIRRSGSVPEAAGRSAKISVSIGPSGKVTGKRLTKSTGVGHADSIALGLVPGRFAPPPPECGTVSIRVTVKFQGGANQKMPSRENRKKASEARKKKKANVPTAVDKALRELD